MTEEKAKLGRKPIADKKVPITVYRPKSEVSKLGGLPTIRTLLNDFLNQKKTTNE